jgi:aminopeptidase
MAAPAAPVRSLPVPDDDVIARYADLIVEVGANVQPGQPVEIMTELGNETLLRAVAEQAFRAGASFVDTTYIDPYVIRAQLELAPLETIGRYPGWVADRVRGFGRERAAAIWLCGSTERHLLDDVDPDRVGRWRPPGQIEANEITNERTWAWTIAGAPSLGWARDVFPNLAPAEALAQLWDDIATIARLDAPDPKAAWRARCSELDSVAAKLDALRLDALHFQGPGTDLVVGLLPTSRWKAGTETTVDGIEHLVNIPTEEVFTAPDPERAEGTVRATRPLDLSGALVEGIVVRFEGGRAVSIDADRGADILRRRVAADERGARLGEVALVDRESRVGRMNRVYLDTLYDENAASHIAFGGAYTTTAGEEDRARINDSTIHIDFMIGGDEVAVTGITSGGERIPLLRGGRWQE